MASGIPTSQNGVPTVLNPSGIYANDPLNMSVMPDYSLLSPDPSFMEGAQEDLLLTPAELAARTLRNLYLQQLQQQQQQQPQQQQAPMSARNERLGLMLYALGGALRGDENFVQNTLALQQMQEGKKKQEARKKAYDEFLEKLDKDSPFYDLAKAMGAENLDKLLLERYRAETAEEQPAQVPADIQKLNQVKSLRERLNPSSPNYDPSYTEERFRQDASVLGVSSNLFAKTKTEFIEEYMEQMRAMKSPASGRPIYTDEQLRESAESAYELIYGQQPQPQPDDDVIDLGTLDI